MKNTRGAGMICLVVGLGLTAFVWHSVLTEGEYDLKAAVLAPILIFLAVGFLVHGDRMPTTRATPLHRAYGLAGSVCAIVQLYFLGFFRPEGGRVLGWFLAATLIGAWFLPGRVFEQRAQPREGRPQEPSPARAIEPE